MYAAYPETLAELNLEIGSQNCNNYNDGSKFGGSVQDRRT